MDSNALFYRACIKKKLPAEGVKKIILLLSLGTSAFSKMLKDTV